MELSQDTFQRNCPKGAQGIVDRPKGAHKHTVEKLSKRPSEGLSEGPSRGRCRGAAVEDPAAE